MMEFLIYDMKVAVLVAVFYMFYRLLLSHETLHRMNRMVLLSTAVGSFVLPLCVITIHHTVVLPQVTGSVTAHLPLATVMEESEPLQPWWQLMAIVTFFTGVAITLGHLSWSVLQVVCLIRQSEQHPQADGIIVCVTDNDVSPFSWMRYIVLNRQDYENPDLAIMAHERGHICQRHSLDVFLVDTLTVLQWFNPAMWMLRQDLRAIHEYEADAAVLSQGINMRQYQYLLIQKAVAACGYSVVNGINHSTLKNRITMMLDNKKTTSKSWLKVLALLPIVGVTLALNAESVNDYVYETSQQQPPKKMVKKGKKDAQIKLGEKTVEVKTDNDAYIGENKTVELKTVGILQDQQESKRKKLIVIGDKQEGPEPLIVINGKESTAEQMKALDSKDIDHIDVLKEKSATELFGEKGKNGVVIITTKKVPVIELGEAKAHTSGVDFKDAKVVDTEYEKVFDVVEQMPEFQGGQEELMKFLATRVRYPEAALKVGAQGLVVVQFIVETDGSISNVRVVKNTNDDLDAEAVRVVGSMPKWKPGRQNGQAVRVKYTLPVTFRLN